MSIEYFAGLVDGEGCITIKRTAPRNAGKTYTYTLCLAIEMSDPRPIKAFCDFFGLIMTYNTTRNRKNPIKHRYLYVAHMGVHKSIEVLGKLIPFLVSKKEEALLAIEFYERCYKSQDPHAIGRARKPVPKSLIELRHSYYLKLQKLKRQSFDTYQRKNPL